MILDRLRYPVVQAPMAGGASTVDLVVAVGEAGGLGFLAGAGRAVAGLRSDVEEVRRRTDAPFGVNLFVPSRPSDPDVFNFYVASLGPDAGAPVWDDDGWEGKLSLLQELAPPVVSFAFGCPRPTLIERFEEVWVTVTSPDEALRAGAAGATALVVQGAEAGGHQSAWDDAAAPEPRPLLELLASVESDLPLIAAGGLTSAGAVQAALDAGARAVQAGSAFLLCPEAGTAGAQRRALGEQRPTALTRAFTGRRARGLVNDFMRAHDAGAPSAYPEVHHATRPIRARGEVESLHLWAGVNYREARPEPAAAVVARLSPR